MLKRDQSLALYMAGAFEDNTGKMGLGALRYSPNPIAAIVDPAHAGEDSVALTGIDRPVPIVSTLAEAKALGADVLLLGIAPPGGLIPASWWPTLDEAVSLGFCLINGLHDRLGPRYASLASDQWVWDIRIEPEGLGVASGAAAHLPNKRLLIIGTDMAIGKMTAGLEIYRLARERGIQAEFVATGQIGITVTGSGIPLDAIRVDFAAGSVEREVMRYQDAQLVIVEGQGSLIHPGSTANLPLLRGSCPTHLILCHRAGMSHPPRLPWLQIPPLRDVARLYEDLGAAAGTYPRPVTCAVALNTAHLDDESARLACQEIEAETGWPTEDPVRHGCERLLASLGF